MKQALNIGVVLIMSSMLTCVHCRIKPNRSICQRDKRAKERTSELVIANGAITISTTHPNDWSSYTLSFAL